MSCVIAFCTEVLCKPSKIKRLFSLKKIGKTGVSIYMVEARGIEPRSEALQQSASTCVVYVLMSRVHAPTDRIMSALAQLRVRRLSLRMIGNYPVLMTFALPHRQEQIERRLV
jgi:hypothetical protein